LLAKVAADNAPESARGLVRFGVTIAGDILFTLLGSIVVNYFSRQREFRADKGAANYSGRQNMIAALRRLQSVYAVPSEPTQEKDMLATMKISDRRGKGLMSLFKTHPDLEDRIAALQKNAF
jgi:heat shock protein HtpX